MPGSVGRQIEALWRKNWIIFARHWKATLFRALLLPALYSGYLIETKQFYNDSNVYSAGEAKPMQRLPADLFGNMLVVAGAPDGSTAHTLVTAALSSAGVDANVQYVGTAQDIVTMCPESFGDISPCFAGLVFGDLDVSTGTLNYTMRGDDGLTQVDPVNPANDDFQKRFLPLQWAIESTWINMTTGTLPDPPLVWEYTTETQEQYKESLRKTFAKNIRSMLVVSYIIAFFPVLYTMAGRMAAERQAKLTEHLAVMGCSTLARIVSWHLSVSAVHLPGWVAMAAIYYVGIFKNCGAGVVIATFIIAGLLLASWSMLVAAPFARHPTIAAIICCGAALFLSIFAQLIGSNLGAEIVLTFIFPPMYIIFSLRTFGSWEIPPLTLNIAKKSPNGDAPIIALMVVAIVAIFVYPCFAVLVEHLLYDVRPTHGRGWFLGKRLQDNALPSGVAVSINHLRKRYTSRRYLLFGKKHETVAIEDLTFDIPRSQIFCLLGRNGAAKSTTLNAISGLVSTSGGSVRYADDLKIGVASQQDVLWDDLTPEQHVRLWHAIKQGGKSSKQDNLDLLTHCDLSKKLGTLAKTLSGGQKRKLALACALAGGSDLLLLDEVSSGLDPISRRAIWRLIAANRGTATIVLTTHFLDEADYLGDNIAVLKAPGQLLAVDSPVALKTRLGRGFTIALTDTPGVDPMSVLEVLREEDPEVTYKYGKGRIFFITGSNDIALVRGLTARLEKLRRQRPDIHFQIGSTTLEEVFLDLNADPTLEPSEPLEEDPKLATTRSALTKTASEGTDLENSAPELERAITKGQLFLTAGRRRPWVRNEVEMAMSVAHKRFLILRRSWIMPALVIIAAVCAACGPLSFLKNRDSSCANAVTVEKIHPMVYPASEFVGLRAPPLISLSGISSLSNWSQSIGTFESVADNATFGATLQAQRFNLTFGGMSLFPLPSKDNIVAFEGTETQLKGLAAMNLFTNAVMQQLKPGDEAFRIATNWQFIPSPYTSGFGKATLWVVFFGLAMALWPTFAGIYPTWEKASQVRANQYSNGAKPAGLWLGHLFFEFPVIIFIPTLLTIVFAALGKFHGLGVLWLVMILYSIAQVLWAFMLSLLFKNPLAAWAATAFFNAVCFILYFTMYFLLLAYDKSPNADTHLSYAHYGFAAINPIGSLMRAAFASLNLFKLLCDGAGNPTKKNLGDISLFGAPILYLFVQALFAFRVCVWVDSGKPAPVFFRHIARGLRSFGHKPRLRSDERVQPDSDVLEEKQRIEYGTANDTVMVRGLTKKFGKLPVPSVDDVSFGVEQGDTFALIGPNGAGKTTTLACIRGVERPTRGDAIVTGYSIVTDRNKARSSLGVCPQVNALDANLTVFQHLWLYGRLKGVPRSALKRDIDVLLAVSGLTAKTDELAPALSGGNQRKLSLMIALIGDRPVILIDEFSSGVDPFSKREAWRALASLTAERAVVMTTHSMEEVDALASRVGIIAAKMLAVGTPASLKSRFATYEVHVNAEQVEPVIDYLQGHGLPAHRSFDTVTRLSVPGIKEDELDSFLGVLQGAQPALGLVEMTVHEASTEAAFLAIVQEHNVREDMFHNVGDKGKKPGWRARRKARKQERRMNV